MGGWGDGGVGSGSGSGSGAGGDSIGGYGSGWDIPRGYPPAVVGKRRVAAVRPRAERHRASAIPLRRPLGPATPL